MSFNNIIGSGKSYTSPIMSEYQRKSKDTEESKKKKQIISEKEGKYYNTYVVDEKGQKVLINKVSIEQIEKQKNSQNSIGSDEAVKNYSTTSKCIPKMHMEAVHRKNIQEVMDILRGNIGIHSNSKKSFG